MLNYGGKYIHNDDYDQDIYNKICSRNMDKSLKRATVVLLIVMLSFVNSLLESVFAYIVDGNRDKLLSVR